jgi:hypothetical protein
MPFLIDGTESRKVGDWLLVSEVWTVMGPRKDSLWLTSKRVM